MWIGLALGIGTIVSAGLSILTPLPAYIGSMICTAIIFVTLVILQNPTRLTMLLSMLCLLLQHYPYSLPGNQ